MSIARVIIAGGRDFNDYETLNDACEGVLWCYRWMEVVILSGGAKGADELGERFSKETSLKEVTKVSLEKYPADWDKYGNAAGPIRNELMAKNADICILFWDGKSKGAKNMISNALKHGLETHIFFYENVEFYGHTNN